MGVVASPHQQASLEKTTGSARIYLYQVVPRDLDPRVGHRSRCFVFLERRSAMSSGHSLSHYEIKDVSDFDVGEIEDKLYDGILSPGGDLPGMTNLLCLGGLKRLAK